MHVYFSGSAAALRHNTASNVTKGAMSLPVLHSVSIMLLCCRHNKAGQAAACCPS
jgi:hypothetical protein